MLSSCVNIEYQLADSFEAICEVRGAACVFNNICNCNFIDKPNDRVRR